MKVLETTKRVLKWLSLYTVEENATKWQKISYIAFSVTVSICVTILAVSSFLFFWKYISIDLEEALYGLCQLNACMVPIYMLIVAFILRKEIIAMIDGLSKIYETNKYEDSFRYLTEANDKSEWIWAIYFNYIMKAFLITMSLSSIISIIFCFITQETFDVNYVYHPYRLLLPWDIHSLVSYIAEILLSMTGCQAYSILNGAFLLLLASMCLHHNAFYKIFRHSLNKLDHHNDNQNNKKILCDLVRFHISVKGWFFESAEVYSSFVLIALIGNMLFMAGAVFQLDLYSKHVDYNLIFILMATSLSFLNLFVYCFYGEMASESFAKMPDNLYESNWQKLPIILQKHFVVMIANAQRPIYYHGFGIAVLNLETFISMVRVAFSYYMIFKTLTSE